MNDQNFVDAETLAELLSLPAASVRRLAREGRLPCYRAGRLLRFDVAEVKAALKAERVKA